MGVFFFWGVVFVCRERGVFDGWSVFLEWKWWFSCGSGVDLCGTIHHMRFTEYSKID